EGAFTQTGHRVPGGGGQVADLVLPGGVVVDHSLHRGREIPAPVHQLFQLVQDRVDPVHRALRVRVQLVVGVAGRVRQGGDFVPERGGDAHRLRGRGCGGGRRRPSRRRLMPGQV